MTTNNWASAPVIPEWAYLIHPALLSSIRYRGAPIATDGTILWFINADPKFRVSISALRDVLVQLADSGLLIIRFRSDSIWVIELPTHVDAKPDWRERFRVWLRSFSSDKPTLRGRA